MNTITYESHRVPGFDPAANARQVLGEAMEILESPLWFLHREDILTLVIRAWSDCGNLSRLKGQSLRYETT